MYKESGIFSIGNDNYAYDKYVVTLASVKADKINWNELYDFNTAAHIRRDAAKKLELVISSDFEMESKNQTISTDLKISDAIKTPTEIVIKLDDKTEIKDSDVVVMTPVKVDIEHELSDTKLKVYVMEQYGNDLLKGRLSKDGTEERGIAGKVTEAMRFNITDLTESTESNTYVAGGLNAAKDSSSDR